MPALGDIVVSFALNIRDRESPPKHHSSVISL